MKLTSKWPCVAISGVSMIAFLVALWAYHRRHWLRFEIKWYLEERRAEKLVRDDPMKLEHWTRLGCAKYWTGDKLGSYEAYHHAWTLDTNNIDLNYAVAFGLREVGRDDDAEQWFSNIVAMCQQRGHPEWAMNAHTNLWLIHTYSLKSKNQPTAPANAAPPHR